jgi:DNA-binding NtrC family response regulator
MTSTLQLEGLVFAGDSLFAERLRVQVRRIAPHFRTALLIGEQGTGKCDLARELHRLSPVADGPFVSCSAEEFARGAVDDVRSGTLYLQHLGTLRAPAQDDLMKRLQRLDARPNGETRLIVANESPLRGMVAAGRMRQELQARVGAIEIRLPRLRERLDDLRAMLSELPLSEPAIAHLLEHSWPGNLNELRQILVQAHLASGGTWIELAHLPALAPTQQTPPREPAEARLDFVMKRHVADVLERCAGNKLRAAEMLGISRSTLYRMLDTPEA